MNLSRALGFLSFAALGMTIACGAPAPTETSQDEGSELSFADSGVATADSGAANPADAGGPIRGCLWCALLRDGTLSCDNQPPPDPKGGVCSGIVKCENLGDGAIGYATATCQGDKNKDGGPPLCGAADVCANAPPVPAGPLPTRAVLVAP